MKREARSFYIYALFRPSGEIFYIGKGRGNRLHVHGENSRSNLHVARIIAKAGRDGVACSRRILRDELTEEEAFALEREMIASIGREDRKRGPLVNLTDGGEGMSNPCAETRAKLSLAHSTRPRNPHREDSKAKMRAARAANPSIFSDERRSKLSAAHKARVWTDESREKARLAAFAREAAMAPEERSERARKREAGKKECGFVISAETRAKLSAFQSARVRQPHTEEAKAKIAAAKRGHKHSDEWKAQMSVSQKTRIRKPHSQETKNRISATKLLRKLGAYTNGSLHS